MGEEIEVQVLEINPDKIQKLLKQLGAKKIFDGKLHSIYYSAPQGEHLRLRNFVTHATLTYKEPISKEDAKVRLEHETKVEFKEMKHILDKLGFEIIKEIKKHRISYELKEFRYDIDTTEDIPPMMEIEAPTEEKLKDAIELVGLTMKDVVAMTGQQVVDHYKKR